MTVEGQIQLADQVPTHQVQIYPTISAASSHPEDHFDYPETIRDIVIGLSDGLTVPFALAAGLSSLGNTHFVIYGGVAELVSGAISMGLGGYLAARSEMDHYTTERQREEREVRECPDEEEKEIVDILEPYGLDSQSLTPLVTKLRSDPVKWVDFMMKFELGLDKPDAKRAWISALTIGFSYLVGGLIPLIPYFCLSDALTALWVSIGVTSFTLLVFGYIKARYVNPRMAVLSAFQTLAVGAVAAGASYGIIRALPNQGA